MYKITIAKDYIHFCSAHFIIFDATNREMLHGHNYYVSLELCGHYLADSKLADVTSLKLKLKEICDELDHKTLLPAKNEFLTIRQDDQSIHCTYSDQRFVFPAQDVKIIEYENTTMEILAHYIADKLENDLNLSTQLSKIEVTVEETSGQSAAYQKVYNNEKS
ncbi:MAG: 6-carboxytetrahydropterin synthase [Calditrichaeota bacterium]|nr:6-carboxytetrahydropterin synthase [Calditrichota bacterium]